MLVVVHVHVNERRRDGWSRRERNERKNEYPEEGGRLGVEVVGIVEGERVVGKDSRDGLFDLRSRLPPLRFQLFSSFFFLRLSLFLFNNFPFFPLYRVVERERERGWEGRGGWKFCRIDGKNWVPEICVLEMWKIHSIFIRMLHVEICKIYASNMWYRGMRTSICRISHSLYCFFFIKMWSKLKYSSTSFFHNVFSFSRYSVAIIN